MSRAALSGDPDAQFNLGVCYASGLGVSVDLPQAARWYRKAAERGNEKAETNLGYLYFRGGKGVARDYKEAVKWFSRAAEKGVAVAQAHMGDCHYIGAGVEKSKDKAVEYYRLAAAQGDSRARARLQEIFKNAKAAE